MTRLRKLESMHSSEYDDGQRRVATRSIVRTGDCWMLEIGRLGLLRGAKPRQ
jgi:hypothetical protein